MRKSLLIAVAAALAAYTQLVHLTDIPGLHFDEAWQGLFAQRIRAEPGFFPLSAMNSYTTPLVHYLLSGAFALFGPSLATMRGTYAAMNFTSLALIAALLWRSGERLAVAWFVLLWALLPLSVHDHRFYVEVTGFHGLCLAILLWGVALWRRRPWLSCALIFGSVVAGTYSHVLFIAVFGAGIFALARSFPGEFRSKRSQRLIALTALALLPLPLRMGLGLHKLSPFALAAGLFVTGIWALFAPGSVRFDLSWQRWPRRTMRLTKLVFFASVPFLVAYVALMWNGFWPYAQATGKLRLGWFPINALMFVGLAITQLRRRASAPFVVRDERSRFLVSPSLVWGAFIAAFLITSVLILKQSPRYYTVPTMLAMVWCAQRLARLRSEKLQWLTAVLFVGWNLWAFQMDYLRQFEVAGANTNEFKVLLFHDNARDFRPFQKIVEWALARNCLNTDPWVEDDRFDRPFRFMMLTARADTAKTCPWHKGDLFYSHIPDYDPSFAGARNDSNTPPPPEAPNVKFLAHSPDWGDLAVWIKR